MDKLYIQTRVFEKTGKLISLDDITQFENESQDDVIDRLANEIYADQNI